MSLLFKKLKILIFMILIINFFLNKLLFYIFAVGISDVFQSAAVRESRKLVFSKLYISCLMSVIDSYRYSVEFCILSLLTLSACYRKHYDVST